MQVLLTCKAFNFCVAFWKRPKVSFYIMEYQSKRVMEEKMGIARNKSVLLGIAEIFAQVVKIKSPTRKQKRTSKGIYEYLDQNIEFFRIFIEDMNFKLDTPRVPKIIEQPKKEEKKEESDSDTSDWGSYSSDDE